MCCSMQQSDWIQLAIAIATIVAALVFLYVAVWMPRCERNTKRNEARKIIKYHLEQLKKDLLNVRDKRAQTKPDWIFFNDTSFSETKGYYFLFFRLIIAKF